MQIGLKRRLQRLKAGNGGVEIGVFQIREHCLGGDVLIIEAILAVFEFFHLGANLAVDAGDAIEIVLEAFGGVGDAGLIAAEQGFAELSEIAEDAGRRIADVAAPGG